MKLLIENWKNYLEEATEMYINRLDSGDEIGGSDNKSFDDIFATLAGGGNRAILNYQPTELDRINYLISRAVHKTKINKKTTEKDDRDIVNSEAVVVVTGFNIKFNPETRKRSIGQKKFEFMNLEKFALQYQKIVKSLPRIVESIENMEHNKAVGITTSIIKFFYKDQDPRKLSEDPKINLRNLTKDLYSPDLVREADELVRLIQKNKKEITSGSSEWPDDTSDVIFIFTREPLEVLRMSDHPKLNSCHSLGGKYDHCVLADAKKDGAIIYSVSKSQFEKQFGQSSDQNAINSLSNEEIFKDRDRDVDGVQPTGRVRVRKIKLQGIEFAVVEKSVYGSFPIGSRDKIADLLAKIQESKYKQLKQPVDLVSQGVSYGGSYQDTSFDEMIKEALEFLGIKYIDSGIGSHISSEKEFEITHEDFYIAIEEDNYELDDFNFSNNSRSRVYSNFFVSEMDDGSGYGNDGRGYYQDIGYYIEAYVDMSPILPRLDIEKLEQFLRPFNYTDLKGFDEFQEYFTDPHSIRFRQLSDGGAIITFKRKTDYYGSTDDIQTSIEDLRPYQVDYHAEYVDSMQKLTDNPDLLLEIFKDFLKPESLNERLMRLKSKIRRAL